MVLAGYTPWTTRRVRASAAPLIALTALCAASAASCKAAPTGGPGEPIGPAPTPRAAVAAPACESPELWLALHARAELAAPYCAACPARCEGEAIDPMPWAMLGDASDMPYTCHELDYVAIALAAYHGQAVTSPFWRPHFEQQPWYRPDPIVTEAALPTVARDNIRWLTDAAAACRARGDDDASQADWDLVIRWFERRAAGDIELPEHLFTDGNPSTREQFLAFLNTENLFRFTRRTPLRVETQSVAATALPDVETRTIVVGTGNPGSSCVGYDEACEGFEWIEFTVDQAGTLRALHVAAAACPIVYVERDGERVQQGEILRNLNAPRLEGSQRLRLVVGGCDQPLRVILAEEKQEISYVDAVILEIDGVEIWPQACADSAFDRALPICADDGRYHRIAPGESLVLDFAPPAGAPCGHVALRANGYYTPLTR